MNVTKPAQASLYEEGIHAWIVGLLQNVLIGHMVHPRNAKDPSQAPHVTAVKAVFLVFVGCPAVAAIEKGTRHAGPIHCDLGG